MDKKAIYNLTYGVFMLSTKNNDITNGCIINTCMQVAGNPIRIAISVLNTNYTCELIGKSGKFALSILDKECSYETIRHFGLQSGRDVDKFGGIPAPTDCNGIPYIGWHTCSVISGVVTESHNLGTHTLFIAEVVDAKVLNDNEPLTYADYQNKLKPESGNKSENKDNRKIVGWRCKICNYVYEGSKLPEDYICPLCGHGADDFEPIYE